MRSVSQRPVTALTTQSRAPKTIVTGTPARSAAA
jgi:hypothetical protein